MIFPEIADLDIPIVIEGDFPRHEAIDLDETLKRELQDILSQELAENE